MTYSLTHALTPGTTENITDVKENIEDAVKDVLAPYRMIFSVDAGALPADAAAATYQLRDGDVATVSGAATHSVGSGTRGLPVFYFDNADYDVTGMTQKLRVRAQLVANATQPTITMTVGLYPVTVAGSADVLLYTLGTVISGSTVAFASPAANTVTSATSGDFTIPSDGAYALGVVTSAQLTNNAAVQLAAQLQLRHVE